MAHTHTPIDPAKMLSNNLGTNGLGEFVYNVCMDIAGEEEKKEKRKRQLLSHHRVVVLLNGVNLLNVHCAHNLCRFRVQSINARPIKTIRVRVQFCIACPCVVAERSICARDKTTKYSRFSENRNKLTMWGLAAELIS